MDKKPRELQVEDLRRVCDPGIFTFVSTAELLPLNEIIGQDRAVRATSFGVDMESPGYHMFALGPTGTGKNGHENVQAGDVIQAVTEQIYRANQLEGRIQEMIDTEGKTLGQVNGISVLPLGDYHFGKPTRITARTGVGKAGGDQHRAQSCTGRAHP